MVKSFAQFINESTSTTNGIDFLYRHHPELEKIGTMEQYSRYLDTIFPESQVKDIVYHGSNYLFDRFEKRDNLKNEYSEGSYKAGWFFAKDPLTPKSYIDSRIMAKMSNYFGFSKDKNPTIYSVLLDIRNPSVEDRHGERGIGFDEVNSAIANKNDAYIAKNVIDPTVKTDVFVVFEPEQIYVLGSKKDTESFKEFVESQSR